MLSKNVVADHVTSVWLAKLHNDMKQYINVRSSITQTGKITVCINKQKIVQE
jgi:hypothetical protein